MVTSQSRTGPRQLQTTLTIAVNYHTRRNHHAPFLFFGNCFINALIFDLYELGSLTLFHVFFKSLTHCIQYEEVPDEIQVLLIYFKFMFCFVFFLCFPAHFQAGSFWINQCLRPGEFSVVPPCLVLSSSVFPLDFQHLPHLSNCPVFFHLCLTGPASILVLPVFPLSLCACAVTGSLFLVLGVLCVET